MEASEPTPGPSPEGYVFSVFNKCPPLPAKYERGEGRGGESPNITRRCSLLSPALSSLGGGEGEEKREPLNTYQEGNSPMESERRLPSWEGLGVGCSETVSTVLFVFLAGAHHHLRTPIYAA
jgi:hypothetical protein